MSTYAAVPELTGHEDDLGLLRRRHDASLVATPGHRTGAADSRWSDPGAGRIRPPLSLDPSIIPLPGIRTEQQARENASLLAVGPLPQSGDRGNNRTGPAVSQEFVLDVIDRRTGS